MIRERNLLYLDDETVNLNVFKTVFQSHFNVFVTDSIEQANDILKNESIQVVMVDQRMPDMEGIDFIKSISEEYPGLVKILITGYQDSKPLIEAINHELLHGYVLKPWNKDDLQQRLDNAFNTYWLKYDNQQLLNHLEDALNELNMFLYRASHDLKGPVASLKGIIELARLEGQKESQEQYFDMLKTSLTRLENVLNKLLIVEKINQQVHTVEWIDFQELLNEIFEALKQDLMQIHFVKIDTEIQPDIKYRGIRIFIYVLLYQLFENSLHFIDREKQQNEVVLKISALQDQMLISLADNGLGIKPNIRNNIFDMFFRGNTNSKGNGLGLYIVKKIIRKLNGRLDVESEVGRGTQIEIALPLEPPDI
jgi:signal transduction histidine kinase